MVDKFDKKRSISRNSFDFAHILPPFFEQLKCLRELLKVPTGIPYDFRYVMIRLTGVLMSVLAALIACFLDPVDHDLKSLDTRILLVD